MKNYTESLLENWDRIFKLLEKGIGKGEEIDPVDDVWVIRMETI